MNLEQLVTSLELSKKLKELGVKQKSLFYWFQFRNESSPKEQWKNVYSMLCRSAEKKKYKEREYLKDLEFFSAFTAAELSILMPLSYIKNDVHYFIQTTAGISHGKLVTTCESHFYLNENDCIAIVGDDFDGEGNEANARALMLIFLIENKLIEKGLIKNDNDNND